MAVDKRKVATSFSKSAEDYAEHAVLQNTVAERLLERLDLINISPKMIVDAGSGPGKAAAKLAEMYRGAHVLQLDLSIDMLRIAKAGAPRFFSKQHYLCADVENLPMARNSADLLFSSLMLQWCNDLDETFAQIKNTLSKQGLFLFASLGPDTLKELRASWAEVDAAVHVNTFIDMHDVGDALLRAGFVEPVMDVENITMTYKDCFSLMQDLKTLGANNINSTRTKGLTGKNKIDRMVAAYEKHRINGRLPATYEVVYGHAWVPDREPAPRSAGDEVFVPVSSIKSRHAKS